MNNKVYDDTKKPDHLTIDTDEDYSPRNFILNRHSIYVINKTFYP